MVSAGGGIGQGDIWWADLGKPAGSTAGYARPVVVIQGDRINTLRVTTYLSVPLTTNPRFASLPWTILLRAADSGLERDSVAQVGLLLAVDERQLTERVGRIAERQLHLILDRLDLLLGR